MKILCTEMQSQYLLEWHNNNNNIQVKVLYKSESE